MIANLDLELVCIDSVKAVSVDGVAVADFRGTAITESGVAIVPGGVAKCQDNGIAIGLRGGTAEVIGDGGLGIGLGGGNVTMQGDDCIGFGGVKASGTGDRMIGVGREVQLDGLRCIGIARQSNLLVLPKVKLGLESLGSIGIAQGGEVFSAGKECIGIGHHVNMEGIAHVAFGANDAKIVGDKAIAVSPRGDSCTEGAFGIARGGSSAWVDGHHSIAIAGSTKGAALALYAESCVAISFNEGSSVIRGVLGVAISGKEGEVTSGELGVSYAGIGGQARAGVGGVLVIQWQARTVSPTTPLVMPNIGVVILKDKLAVGIIGVTLCHDGSFLQPDVFYKVDTYGQFIKVP